MRRLMDSRFMAVAKRVWAQTKTDNLGLLAAGVAFYAMLAIFPSVIALVTVYALVADPGRIAGQIEPVASLLPPEAQTLLIGQLREAAEASGGSLSFGLIISIAAALWAASGGVGALMTGINAVYNEEEKRGFVKLKAMALGLTLGAICVVILSMFLVAAFPPVMSFLNLEGPGRAMAEVLRWVLLITIVAGGLAVFYRLGPSRDGAKMRWVSWGAAIALVIWLLGSVGFSLYVSNFADYNKTYGTLAAVVILMLWLYLSAYVILLGAEIDSELEDSKVTA
jgi:membrane protein